MILLNNSIEQKNNNIIHDEIIWFVECSYAAA